MPAGEFVPPGQRKGRFYGKEDIKGLGGGGWKKKRAVALQ